MKYEMVQAIAALHHLPFINFLRLAETIPILLLTCDKVCAEAPDILRFHCTETSTDELLESGTNVEAHKQPVTIIKASDMEIYLEQRLTALCGKELPLTPKEFDILSLLISNPRRVFINNGEAMAPGEIKDRSICINADIGSVLAQVRKLENKLA